MSQRELPLKRYATRTVPSSLCRPCYLWLVESQILASPETSQDLCRELPSDACQYRTSRDQPGMTGLGDRLDVELHDNSFIKKPSIGGRGVECRAKGRLRQTSVIWINRISISPARESLGGNFDKEVSAGVGEGSREEDLPERIG